MNVSVTLTKSISIILDRLDVIWVDTHNDIIHILNNPELDEQKKVQEVSKRLLGAHTRLRAMVLDVLNKAIALLEKGVINVR
jgi:hypothetical protein